MNSELYKQIVNIYKQTGSVRETAERLKTYPIKVRRVLLTEGLWSSKTSRAIDKYLRCGLTTAEIAEKMCVTEKAVQHLIPYNRGEYNLEERSGDAKRSNEYRERMREAEARQVFVNDSKNSFGAVVIEKETKVLKLHLELDIQDADIEVLRQYGKVKDGITRDILVPGDMTLHALHYVIQRAFGWQNSHLHNFTLPEKIFNSITKNSISKWLKYCGVYFRCPDTDNIDIFWDDDYKEGQSFKTWLNQKYTGPYCYGGITERFKEAQSMAKNLLKEFGGNPTRKDLELFAGGQIDELLERLTVSSIMLPEGITDTLIYSYDYGDDWEVKITCEGVYDSNDCEEQIETVLTQWKPLCIAADGLPVLDDVGGIYGYCNFLLGLHGIEQDGPYEDKESTKEWAKMLGWTGKMSKPEKML